MTLADKFGFLENGTFRFGHLASTQLLRGAISAALVGGLVGAAQAQTWNGTSTGNWTDSANWSTGTAPAANANVILTGPATFQPLIGATTVNLNTLFAGYDAASGGVTLGVIDGAALTTNSAIIGEMSVNNAGNARELEAGTVNVLSGSTWTAGSMQIGGYGKGTVNVSGGSTLTVTSATSLGVQRNGTTLRYGDGSINVSGIGSTFNGQGLTIGQLGVGAVSISGGAKANTGATVIGQSSQSEGSFTVTGAGSKWSLLSGTVTVGQSGSGTLSILNGGQVTTTGRINVSQLAGSDGLIEVKGANSTLGAGQMWVGMGAAGHVAVEGGGTVNATHLLLGTTAGISGTVSLKGTNSSLTANTYTMIGFMGSGAITVSDGATLRGPIHIAYANGSTGTLNIGAAQADAAGAAGVIDAPTIAFGSGTGLIVLNHTDDNYQLASNISGAGSILVKSGTTTLTGTNTYTGGTIVEGGKLYITGSHSGSVTLGAGSTLGGNGTVGSTIVNGGTVAAGNSIGTLTVAGNLTIGANSVLATEVKAGGNTMGVHNDVVVVTGILDIAPSATVVVTPENGSDTGVTYAPSTTYTILTSAGRTGTFAGIAESFAFLDGALSYDPNNVYLTLTRNSVAFTDIADTPNRRATAGALNGFDGNDPVIGQLYGLDAAGANRAFDLASGEIHASAQTVTGRVFDLFRLSPSSRGVSASTVRHGGEKAFWLTPLAGRGTLKDDGNAGAVDWSAGGLAVGFDKHAEIAGHAARLGIGFGYLDSRASLPSRLSSMDAQGAFVRFYGDWSNDVIGLSGGLAYGANRISTHREIVVGSVTRTAEADYWAHNVGLDMEARYDIKITDDTTFSPLAAISSSWNWHGSAEESGAGSLNVSLDRVTYWRGDTGIGFELGHELPSTQGNLLIKGRAMWLHGFGDMSADQSMSLSGGSGTHTIQAPDLKRDRFKFGAGLEWTPSDATEFAVNYDGVFSGGETQHGLRAALRVAF